jgi:prophage tail gpP-like protein
MANDWEKCEVSIGGQNFSSWESVLVKNDFLNAPPVFTLQTDGAKKIKLGDDCVIKLGGQTAITGYINVIQPAYDGNRHGLQVQGRSKTQDCIDCSIILGDSNNGNFDGQTLSSIANTILKPYSIKFTNKGKDAAFEHAQVHPGETAYQFIKRLALQLKLYLIHDEFGNLIAIDKAIDSSQTQLEEGKNILACRAVLSDYTQMKGVVGLGQCNADDKKSGRAVSQLMVKSEDNPECKRERRSCVVAERPCTGDNLKDRVRLEYEYRASVTMEVAITVYGWLTGGKSGDLWKPARMTMVKSPMAQLSQELWIRSVTFTQDNRSGTRTLIELQRYPQGMVPLTSNPLPDAMGGEGLGAKAAPPSDGAPKEMPPKP